MTEDRLEPHILPRQRRALERIAGRLQDERPVPEEGFRDRLADRVAELDAARRTGVLAGWRRGAAVALGQGQVLLAVAAALAVS
jgi:hypothetical protein